MGWGKEIPDKVIFVCNGSKCCKKGGKEIAKKLKKQLKEEGLKKQAQVIITECTDRCKFAPVLSFQPGNTWYLEVDPEKTVPLFRKHIITDKKDSKAQD